MPVINHAFRRTRLQQVIDRDPWTVTIHKEGRTPDDADSSFSFTGRITPAGTRGAPLTMVPRTMPGEMQVIRYGSVLIAPYDTQAMAQGDLVVATHDESGIVRRFTIAFARRMAWKVEAILDERQ